MDEVGVSSRYLPYLGEHFTLVFDGKIRTFKYYDKEKRIKRISVKSSSYVMKCKNKLFAFDICDIDMKKMMITENKSLQLIDSKFLDKIKKLSDTSNSIYMIVEKKDLALTCCLNSITYYNKKFLRCFSKIKISIDGRPNEGVIKDILNLPNNVPYTFDICGWLGESLDFLYNDRFVNKVKKLNGKITCGEIDIDVKQLCLEETKDCWIDNLKKKIKDSFRIKK